MEHTWRRIAWLYALGVLAAAQLGKMSALAPLIRIELAIGLTVAGLLISLLEIGGATLGYLAGLFVDRIGVRRVLLGGVALIAGSGLGQSLAGSVPMLIALRASEGAGYLCVVVAAPLLIFRTAPPGKQGVALALWGSFVPVGFALGAMSSSWLAELVSWRAAALAWAGVAAIMFAMSAQIAFAPSPQASQRRLVLPPWRIWALTLAFGCYAGFAVGTIALLPSFLVQQLAVAPRLAGTIGGLAAFISVLGVAMAAWLRHHSHESRIWTAMAIVVPAVLLFGVFTESGTLLQATVLVMLLNAVSGIYAGLAFALLPSLAASDNEMAVANGLTLQFGAAGSLMGPPLFAASVERWGWSGAAVVGALASCLCLLLMQGARVRSPVARAHALP